MLNKRLAIDIGSQKLRMIVKGEDAIWEEPAPVNALSSYSIVDRAALEESFTHLIQKAIGRQRIFKPDVMVAVSCALPSSDRRAMLDVLVGCGARTAYLMDVPLAASLSYGEGISPEPRVVVHLGYSHLQAAVVVGESSLTLASVPFVTGDDLVAKTRKLVDEVVVSAPKPVQERLLTGIVTGGRSDQAIADGLSDAGIKFTCPEQPELAPVKGISAALDHFDVLKKAFLYLR